MSGSAGITGGLYCGVSHKMHSGIIFPYDSTGRHHGVRLISPDHSGFKLGATQPVMVSGTVYKRRMTDHWSFVHVWPGH